MHKKKYILAIVLTVVILLSNQVYIQYCLSLNEKDAEIINKAGKQRMYSQKILHLYEHWFITGTKPEKLQEDFSNWKVANSFLNTQVYLSNSLEKKSLLHLTQLIDEQGKLISYPPTKESIKELTLSSSYFLQEMDKLVSIYEAISSEKLAKIRSIEIGLLIVSLLIILGEVLFIFLPLINTLIIRTEELKLNMLKLEQSKNELEQLTYAISHDLQEPISLVEGLILRYKKKKENAFLISGEMMEMLEVQIKKANKLLSDLLLYTDSKIKRTKESFELKSMVEELKLKLNASETIDTSLLNNLKIYGYKQDIALVLEHLLINAITYKSESRDFRLK